MKIVFDSSAAASRFRTGVSLHSHTLHSRESLSILYMLGRRSAMVRAAVRLIDRAFKRATGTHPDLDRAWWTPPLSAHEAWQLEAKSIESAGLFPLVSITDHDNIDGPLSLRVLNECSSVPVSVEWTAPFENTFFHVGVHDLPRRDARGWMSRFARFTAEQSESLASILSDLCDSTSALVVLNHPFWDEAALGAGGHEAALRRFTAGHAGLLHALELNGLRPWTENRKVLEFAKAVDLPVVSGGDRHGFEPSAVLNLTNASTFAEFAEEVRSGSSKVLITARYREAYSLRVLRNFAEMAADLEGHSHGWRHWTQRVFYEFGSGEAKPVSEIFGPRAPATLDLPLRLLGVARLPAFDRAVRFAAPARRLTLEPAPSRSGAQESA